MQQYVYAFLSCNQVCCLALLVLNEAKLVSHFSETALRSFLSTAVEDINDGIGLYLRHAPGNSRSQLKVRVENSALFSNSKAIVRKIYWQINLAMHNCN